MTDKQEMIIDSVDVSGCSALCCGNTCFLSRHYSFTEPKHKQWCSDNPNCHFKQLQRKTAECEELKKQLETAEKWRIKAEGLNEKLELKNTCYRKALEELREECEEHRNNAESYCASYQSSCVVNAKITDIAFKYKQALNEILNIIKDLENTDILTFPDFSTEENYKMIMKQCNSGYVEILDIINKAKEEK